MAGGIVFFNVILDISIETLYNYMWGFHYDNINVGGVTSAVVPVDEVRFF